MKAFTDIEQSKKLAEILPLESADMAWLEKQGELKPINKFVSKFQNGQWIVWQNKCYKVNYNGCGYELIDQNGFSTSLEYGTIDESAHLWDVAKDTKDGDILAYVTDEEDLWLMIYRSLYEPYEGHVHYHALLVNNDFSDKGTCCICIDDLHPATQKQCDILFAKMKEEGFEWDAEKKELKKSQRMVSAEAKEALYDNVEDFDDACYEMIIKLKEQNLLKLWIRKKLKSFCLMTQKLIKCTYLKTYKS